MECCQCNIKLGFVCVRWTIVSGVPPVLCLVSVLLCVNDPASVSPHQRHAPSRGESRSYLLGCLGRGFRGLSGHVTGAGILSRDCTAVHWTRQTCYSPESKQTAARPQDNTGTLTTADTGQTEHQEKNDVKPSTLVMVAICEEENKQPLFLRIT